MRVFFFGFSGLCRLWRVYDGIQAAYCSFIHYIFVRTYLFGLFLFIFTSVLNISNIVTVYLCNCGPYKTLNILIDFTCINLWKLIWLACSKKEKKKKKKIGLVNGIVLIKKVLFIIA